MRVDGATWVRRGEDCSRGAESASPTGRQKRQATPILFIHDQKADLQPEGLGTFCLHGSTRLIRAPSRTPQKVIMRADLAGAKGDEPRPGLARWRSHHDGSPPCRSPAA